MRTHRHSKSNTILILEHLDLEHPGAGGIETIIRAMISVAALNRWVVAGVSSENMKMGVFIPYQAGSQVVDFIPILMLDKASRDKRRLPDSLLYLRNLLFRFRSFQPSIIHAHRIEIGLISKILWPKTPLVMFIHNEGKQLAGNRKSSSFWRFFPVVHKAISLFVIKLAYKIIIFNQQEFLNIKKLRSDAIRGYTWFDPKIFFPSEYAVRNEERLVLSWIGRLESEKDPLFFIDVLSDLAKFNIDFAVNFVGSGTLKNELEKMVEMRGLVKNVHFFGSINQRSLAEVLRSSDVTIQTSHYEGSPTVVVESLACGVPVVTTLEGDPDEVVFNGVNGFRLAKRDPLDFALAIINCSSISRDSIHLTVASRSEINVLPRLLRDSA